MPTAGSPDDFEDDASPDARRPDRAPTPPVPEPDDPPIAEDRPAPADVPNWRTFFEPEPPSAAAEESHAGASIFDDDRPIREARYASDPAALEVDPPDAELARRAAYVEAARRAPDDAPPADETPLPQPPGWWSRNVLVWTLGAAAAVLFGTIFGIYVWNTRGIPPAAEEYTALDAEIRGAERLTEEAELAQFGETVSLDEALAQARRARDLALAQQASPFDVGRAETLVDKLHRLATERKFKAAIEAVWFDEAAGRESLARPGGAPAVPNAERYRLAFRDFGVDVETHDSRQAAQRLGELSEDRLHDAIAALDDWATQADFATRNWLGETLSRLDQDHERMGVRLAVGRGDRHAVARASRDGAILRQPTAQLFFVANTLMAWNQPEDAVAMLQRAQVVRPRDFWIQHLLGSAAQRKNPPDDALAAAAFTAAEALHPNAYTETQLGLSWSRLGRRGEALALWRRAIERVPTFRDARLWLAQADDPSRDAEDAVATYEALRRDYPRDPEVPLAEARFLVHRGLLRESIPLFEEAGREGSTAAPAELADVYARLHQHSDAALAYEWALELSPDEPRWHAAAAESYAMLGRLDDAFNHAQECVLLDPGNVEGRIALVSLYRRKHRADDAIAAARRAIELDPRRADSWDALGLAYAEANDSAAAIDAFRHATTIDPNSARAQSHLGSELALAGRAAEAIPPMRRAIALDPSDHVTRRNLAVLYEQERRWGEAADAWGDLLRLEPLNAEVRCNLAFALQQSGRFTDAAAAYTQAFADSPSVADDLSSLRRYDAARSAVSAAFHDGSPLDASATRVRARPEDLRRQSLEWLRADLVNWRQRLAEEPDPTAQRDAANVLGHWLREPALAPIRESAGLAALPDDERAEWESLWKSVRRVRGDALAAYTAAADSPGRTTVARPPID